MCLLVKKEDAIRRIAEEDIVIYKMIDVIHGELHSPFNYTFKWKLGRLYKTDIKKSSNFVAFDAKEWQILDKSDKDNLVSFGSGFHSALTSDRLDEECGSVIYKGRIPKGAEYILGVTDLVISNQIILDERFSNNLQED